MADPASNDAGRVTDGEFDVLRHVMRMDGERIGDPKAIQSLWRKRFIRPDGDDWMITLEGHTAFLRELPRMFGGED